MFIGFSVCDVSAALTRGAVRRSPTLTLIPVPRGNMTDERGEIQKRLDDNLCPWCMSTLTLVEDTYVTDRRRITRQCNQCSGTVVDHFTFGEKHGDDTRSES